jgi:hypothetical protein
MVGRPTRRRESDGARSSTYRYPNRASALLSKTGSAAATGGVRFVKVTFSSVGSRAYGSTPMPVRGYEGVVMG